MLFRTVPSTIPHAPPRGHDLPFPKIGGSQPPLKTAIESRGKTSQSTYTNSLYGRHMDLFGGGRLGVKSVGIARDRPNFLATPIDSGTGKATVLTSNMAGAFIRCIRTKAH